MNTPIAEQNKSIAESENTVISRLGFMCLYHFYIATMLYGILAFPIPKCSNLPDSIMACRKTYLILQHSNCWCQ